MKSKTNIIAIFSISIVLLGGYLLFSPAGNSAYKGLTIAKTSDINIHTEDIKRYISMRNPAAQNIDIMRLDEAAQRQIIEDFIYSYEAAKKSDELDLLNDVEIEERLKIYSILLKRKAYEEHLQKLVIKEEKLKEGYNLLAKQIKGKVQINTSHILLKTKKEADALLKKINKKNFAELAKKNSIDEASAKNGGALGYIMLGQMVKAYEEAALKLKTDEISKPIETKFGWHIILLEDKNLAQLKPYDSLRDAIAQQLTNDKIISNRIEVIKNTKIDFLLNDTAENKDKKSVVK